MKYLFVLTEFPYPAHRSGVAMINYEIISRLSTNSQVDLLISDTENSVAEMSLRTAAPQLGSITYVASQARRYRIGNLLTGAFFGRCLFESKQAVQYLRHYASSYDAIYIAPLMSYIDVGRYSKVFLNAVDSNARLNHNAFLHSCSMRDWIKRDLYRRYESKILPQMARTNFVSKDDVSYVRNYCNIDSIVCIPLGVDTIFFSPTDHKPEPYTILFTGNYQYNPNKEAVSYFANNILPKILDVQPQTRFYVVGRNPPIGLAKLPGVVVTGFVDDIRDYYNKCSIFVCPMLSGAGIKNKVLEAMASGIPIVTTRLGVDGIDDVQSGEHFLLAESPEKFVECIFQLWENAAQRRRISDAARTIMTNRITWAQMVISYFDHLDQISGGIV